MQSRHRGTEAGPGDGEEMTCSTRHRAVFLDLVQCCARQCSVDCCVVQAGVVCGTVSIQRIRESRELCELRNREWARRVCIKVVESTLSPSYQIRALSIT